MQTPDQHWRNQLETLGEKGLRRRLRCMDEVGGMENFSSNDYLGLSAAPELAEVAKEAVERFGVGSGASRLVCGTFAPHIALEETLAKFKGTEAALAFSTGYATAVGCIPALFGKDDVVILDKLAHASLIDAVRLSGATLRVFPHNDLDKLEALLAWARGKFPNAQILIVTESVFSMDGDRCPLAEIVALKEKHGALLLLDEAHAIGILGPRGTGLASELGLSERVELQLGTLSKAVGVSGGYVCGSRAMVDMLVNRARSFIYSTAPPPAQAMTATAALRLIASAKGEALRKKLWSNLLKVEAALQVPKPQSAIVPILVGDEKSALEHSNFLEINGIYIPAIRYPTVPRQRARLRLTMSASHSETQLEKLFRVFALL